MKKDTVLGLNMWVKSCGTTTLNDARLAAEAGADAVGFVFAAESPRRVTVESVAQISTALAGEFPTVERIGVFTCTDAAAIVHDARAAALTGVQLHREGGVALVEALRLLAPQLSITPVVHWRLGDPGAGEHVRREVAQMVRIDMVRVLLDSKAGAAVGGTGLSFAWDTAARMIADVRGNGRIIVAGGLRSDSVADAIRLLRPWGVDVASGVEAELGRKSPERLQDFLAAARS